ncbi:MAG: ABC transporter ATP-binding protein [Dehalococcoidia bacterium]
MDDVLKVDNLTTQFFTRAGTVRAVTDVSFHVKRGETVGIVGESGCGKSVTAMSLMRIIQSPPGKIVAGSAVLQTDKEPFDLIQADEDELRQVRGKDIAMIFQDPMTSLNPVLTIGYQLTEPLKLHMHMSEHDAKRRATEILSAVGIPGAAARLDDYPHQFSGGMRQRVMVAMALVCNPKLVIADEPTTALDVTIQAQLLELLSELTREMGTAVILITHDLGVVAQTCQRVIVMYGGRVIEMADVDELFDNPQHPYTVGLLRSVPKLGRQMRERLLPIEGSPPDLVSPPQGCRFRPRCPHAFEKCIEEPPLISAGTDHVSRCWLVGA